MAVKVLGAAGTARPAMWLIILRRTMKRMGMVK